MCAVGLKFRGRGVDDMSTYDLTIFTIHISMRHCKCMYMVQSRNIYHIDICNTTPYSNHVTLSSSLEAKSCLRTSSSPSGRTGLAFADSPLAGEPAFEPDADAAGDPVFELGFEPGGETGADADGDFAFESGCVPPFEFDGDAGGVLDLDSAFELDGDSAFGLGGGTVVEPGGDAGGDAVAVELGGDAGGNAGGNSAFELEGETGFESDGDAGGVLDLDSAFELDGGTAVEPGGDPDGNAGGNSAFELDAEAFGDSVENSCFVVSFWLKRCSGVFVTTGVSTGENGVSGDAAILSFGVDVCMSIDDSADKADKGDRSDSGSFLSSKLAGVFNLADFRDFEWPFFTPGVSSSEFSTSASSESDSAFARSNSDVSSSVNVVALWICLSRRCCLRAKRLGVASMICVRLFSVCSLFLSVCRSCATIASSSICFFACVSTGESVSECEGHGVYVGRFALYSECRCAFVRHMDAVSQPLSVCCCVSLFTSASIICFFFCTSKNRNNCETRLSVVAIARGEESMRQRLACKRIS